MNNLLRIITSILILLTFVACTPQTSSTSTPVAPTPPQIKVTQDMAVLKNGLATALTALQAARSNGSLSAADVSNLEKKLIAPMALAGKAIDAEVLTADDWPTMRAKIVAIITRASVAGAGAVLPANAQAILAVSIAAWNSIAASVGGPTI
jgi:hypothetical protein